MRDENGVGNSDHALTEELCARLGAAEASLSAVHNQLDEFLEYYSRAETFAAAHGRSHDQGHPMVYLDDVIARLERLERLLK